MVFNFMSIKRELSKFYQVTYRHPTEDFFERIQAG
jgi:hypothetical protein